MTSSRLMTRQLSARIPNLGAQRIERQEAAAAVPLLIAALAVACLIEPAAAQSRTDAIVESAMEHRSEARSGAATAAVLERNMRAFAARDVDALLLSYTDESVIIAQDAVHQGKQQIRAFFEQLLLEFSSPGATLTMQQRRVYGPIAFIAWTAETSLRRYELGTDTLYIENDRILYQTYAFKAVAK